MATPTLILGANNWAIEEDNILGYALGSSSKQYLPREISFTRGSDATFTDSTGVVRQACWNLLQYSEDFTSGVWGKQNTTITANSTNAPDSALTADQMFDDTSLNWHRIIYTTSVISGNAYTYSIYLKANTETAVQLNTYNIYASNSFNYANFDLQNGVVGTYANCTPSIRNIGNGWYRCSITQTSVVSGTSYLYVTTTNNNPLSSDRPTYAGAGNSFYIWGAQLVQGSEPLAYLRTTDRLNVPRVGSSTGSKAFLLEPQRTNLIIWSQAFSDASWSKITGGIGIAPIVTSNAGISPDGTNNASRVQFNCVGTTSADRSILRETITTTNATNYAGTIYVKAYSSSEVGKQLRFLSEGAVNQIIITLTDSWQKVTTTGVSNTTSSNFIIETRGTFTTNTTADVLIWGAQLELGAYPTTYIPTQATTVTRIADVASATGISGLIGQTEGTIFVDFIVSGIGANNINIYNNDRTPSTISTNAILFKANGSIECQTFLGNGTLTALTISASTYSVGQRIKLAYRYKSGDFAVYINGIQKATATNTLTFVGTKSQIYLNDNAVIYGYQEVVQYNQLALFTTALTNSELAALTL